MRYEETETNKDRMEEAKIKPPESKEIFEEHAEFYAVMFYFG